MIYMYKYKDLKQCHEIKLLRERAGGAKRGESGGLTEWDVGQISLCYPEVVIPPVIGLNQINQQNKHAHTKERHTQSG